MQLLFVKLLKEDLVEDIVTIMTAAGIEKACVAEASTMQQFMGRNIPIFAGLRTEIAPSSYCKIIFARVPDDDCLEEFRRLLKRAEIDLNDEETGAALALPCSLV